MILRGRPTGLSRQASSGRCHRTRAGRADSAHPCGMARAGAAGGGRHEGAGVPGPDQRRLRTLPGAGHVPRPGRHRRTSMTARYSPAELAGALGLFTPTEEQAAVIAAPPGPLVVIAGAGAGKTETMAARVVWLVANGYAEPGRGARTDVHPQGCGPAAAPGPHPAGPAGRRRPRPRRRLTSPTIQPRSAPTTRSQGTCCASTGCCCRSSPTAGCSARPSCGSWHFASCASIPSTSTPTRPRPR